MSLANEHPGDELHGDDALAAIEAQLRKALPAFHLRARLKSITVSKAPRGVFIDATFAKRDPQIPSRVRGMLSRAAAESLRLQLNKVLDV